VIAARKHPVRSMVLALRATARFVILCLFVLVCMLMSIKDQYKSSNLTDEKHGHAFTAHRENALSR